MSERDSLQFTTIIEIEWLQDYKKLWTNGKANVMTDMSI